MSTGNQKLPQKEAGTFKKIVRCYECKQYKNGLKFARQILSNSKFSEHGETMAMKGLILNCMGRKEEAYENVRRGLKNDIKSHVCWHVYGLLQRSDKKYEEAIKCYRNALKWDKENVQILRDLSLLQVQMRDIEGYRDTRYQLLKARPAQRSSWVGYAVSYHLLKDYAMAIKVMAEYRKTQTIPQTRPDVEYSEMILYEVQLMLEAGRTEEAMKHLREYETYIADTLMALETRAEIYLASGKLLDAEDGYRDLINRNPENYGYYSQLEKCLKFDSVEEKVKHYRELQEKYPRSSVARRVPLTITTGEKFAYHLSWYLRRALHKGVPSLFMSIRGLYSDPEKMKVIGDMVTGYVESLRTHGYFLPEDTGVKEPPSAFLWALFLLAQHHDRLGNSVRAVELIDEAIEHTPTDVQLYMLRARIYKHAGDYHKAAKWMEEARTLDTADRFINCKCVKYLLRINQINQAIETAGLFTREGLPPLQTMDEMQCMWFQTELALAYQRLGKPGHALQKLHEIEQHFTDIVDDQFDFHTYCMRRMTLRAYIGVVHLEDTLRHHPFYFVVAKTAVEIYIFLHDNPSAKLAELNGPAEYENKLSAAEMKKVKRKERKAQLKAQAKAHEEKKENKPHNRTEEEKKTEEKGEDKFSPKELVSVERPLEEALKFLTPLQLLSRERIEPHLLAYAVHSRRRKLLLSLQAIKRARVVDPENGGLHAAIVDFALAVQSCRDKLPDPMRVVIDEILPSLTGGLDLSELNRQFIERHQDSLQHLIHGAEVLYRLHPDAQDRAVSLITSLPDTLKDRTLKLCVQVQQLLKNGTLGDCSEVLKSYEDKCHALFPLATAFMPPLVLVPSSKELGDDSNGQSEPPLKNPQVPLEDECSGGQD